MQILINILTTSSTIALMAISFAIIYQIVRFFHFAHGIIFTAGAYFSFFFIVALKLPLLLAIFLSAMICAIFGCLIELAIYRPLRHKNSSPLIFLLSSLGVYILFQNIISMVFGDETRSIRTSAVQEGINFLGARITAVQIAVICLSIVLIIILEVFLIRTRTGKSVRAVANDLELADILGIKSNVVILWVFAIGSALAGLAGILVALDVDMTPTMGMTPLMMGVVAVIIGGMNSITGIAFGALLLSTAQHLGAWYIGSQWQDAIAFVILILFLLFKPEGFFGKKVKSATV
jgi:branched-chain amino acid transport system permease protein